MHTSKSGCRQAPLPGIKPGNKKWESAGSKFDRSTFLITPTGYWVAVPWFRRLTTDLSHRRLGFRPESVHVRFMVRKVSQGQISLQALRISPVSIILPGTHIMWGMHNRPVGGRRSETKSHYNMNNGLLIQVMITVWKVKIAVNQELRRIRNEISIF